MTAFQEASYSAAESFLGTVVVVDNRAAFVPTDEVVLVEPPDEFATVAADEPLPPATRGAPDEANLDAGTLSSSFAELGLVCAILRPHAQDQKKEAILGASKRADIVVLDWQMDDDGELATKIIREMLEADEKAGGRLRLVAVYTGYTLDTVADKLANALAGFSPTVDRREFEKGSSRVIILAKGGQPNAVGQAAIGVAEIDLPKRLINEFAKFTGGLLPNATLAAIDGVRRHTHRMLARFSKDLDGPFLTHRTMLVAAEDAEQYAAELIMAELEAQVPIDRIVADKLGKTAIREFIDHRIGEGLTPNFMLNSTGDRLRPLSLDEACKVIEKGHEGLPNDVQVGKAKLHERLYRLTEDDLAQSQTNHLVFAQRAKMRRDGAAIEGARPPLPALRLGAILASRKAYWVCLTPLCDSGRLALAGDRLLFAELSRSDGKFDFVVRDGSKYIKLAFEKKRTNLASFRFLPGADRVVRVQADREDVVVRSVVDSPLGTRATRFRWLGELKPMHAQKCVQAFSANLARVGLDDFEWHRSQMTDE